MTEREKLDFEIAFEEHETMNPSVKNRNVKFVEHAAFDEVRNPAISEKEMCFIIEKLKAACARIDEYEHRIQELEQHIKNLTTRIENVEEILGE